MAFFVKKPKVPRLARTRGNFFRSSSRIGNATEPVMRDGLITLIFVDWLPPCTDTSRGVLSLASEIGPLQKRSIMLSRIPRPTAAAPRCLSGLFSSPVVEPPLTVSVL